MQEGPLRSSEGNGLAFVRGGEKAVFFPGVNSLKNELKKFQSGKGVVNRPVKEKGIAIVKLQPLDLWSRCAGSNCGPADYETGDDILGNHLT
jgi:hypothetical protein